MTIVYYLKYNIDFRKMPCTEFTGLGPLINDYLLINYLLINYIHYDGYISKNRTNVYNYHYYTYESLYPID